jgi:competence protein ComFC
MTLKTPGQGQSFIKLREHLLDLFFPSHCVCCDKIGFLLCGDCQEVITALGTGLDINAESDLISGIISIGPFQNEALKEAIHRYKYENVFALAPVFSRLLAKKIAGGRISFDLIAFVPSTKKRVTWRGYNQAELIAKELSLSFKKSLVVGLVKTKETKTQVGLPKKKRQKNLSSAFRYTGRPLAGKNILLVDDVSTTGATLSECAKALRIKGAGNIWGAVIGRE